MKFWVLIIFIIKFQLLFWCLGFTEEEKFKGGVISYYCSVINFQSPNCQEWKLVRQQKFEVEEKIFRKIKEKQLKIKNVSLYCLNLNPQEVECQVWKSLRQKQLELKGSLINEIKDFCKQNPQHSFCKSATKVIPKD